MLETDRRPTMIYWTAPDGSIVRAESENSDMLSSSDRLFAEPFHANAIVGRNLFEFIDGQAVIYFYQELAGLVLNTGKAITFEYRCDGPRTRRDMSMKISRDGGTIRYESALIRETLRQREIPAETRDSRTFVAICSFCKSYRFPLTSSIWKELEKLPMEDELPAQFKFTHGICEECFGTVSAVWNE